MESPESSRLSSLRGGLKSEDFIQPHYMESYRLAIDCLASGGRDTYQEFLKGERIGSFLSEEELLFITENAKTPPPKDHVAEINGPPDDESSSGTYWPVHSDVDAPELELGWPDVMQEKLQTNIDLLFHPPRQNNPTIKEVIRKKIQNARQVIAIAMDMFTDVDIFKEAVDASIRGVPVYVILDDFHLKSFLAMAENQNVKIHQLRNMRVRTVKGPDYLCRSGAKFHGAMEQKFLLVDCLIAIYGSYGFTWSFEKIHLSMVQVITGHLVKSYDEEFRTLYARSTVPAELCPPEGLFQSNGPHGQQIFPNTPKIDRRDQLRHTLDTVYRKTCERKLGARDLEERLFEEEPNKFGPFIKNGITVQNQMPQCQSAEMMNFIKRHSYAGEIQDGYMPQNIRPRASNWNISREIGNGTNQYPMDNYLPVAQMHRGQNMRQSYSGNDKQILSMQQNMPTLENTSKAFMHTLRIESYLKCPDVPLGDSCDYLDQFEPQDKANSFMQGRMRSSLVFRSPIPEQLEPNRHINNSSTCANSSAVPKTPLHYSSMQWNPNAVTESRISNDEYMFDRQILQTLDDNRKNANYGPGSNSYHSAYTSLGRAKGRHMITNPDLMSDSWQKRHSVADPRSDTEYKHESSGYMYGAFAKTQVNRSTAGINAQSGGYGSNLKDDQRFGSHYDVKSVTGTKSHGNPIWQEPPSRTVSAAALDVKSKDPTAKPHSMSSQLFIKKSPKTIKSLLNIPEKKEDSAGTIDTQSLQSSGSTDTITEEDEERISYGGGKLPQKTTKSVRSSSGHQRKQIEGVNPTSSKPRFKTEEHQNPLQVSLPKPTTQKKPSVTDRSVGPDPHSASWSKDRVTDNRLYSRFEPFCSFDKKRSAHGFGNFQEKPKSLPKGEAAIEHNLTWAARGHHENKLEKFMHRVGNLIHKNK
ncbi:protein FAM83B [Anarrhichthys ocellatus]|uniref:protein FAM83B n=1 Tax=Anarrhichthys ocellatus TaxID=433405 RepID=UPI0012EDD9BC|nr:protein FAM83B [Anarrhichthys ocellatus]XP_031697592.1 protein FAM83B [Anarrhichthys ocellatus]